MKLLIYSIMKSRKIKLLRITTIPASLNVLLKGQLLYVQSHGFEVLTVSSAGPEIDELVQRENVTHYTIPFTRKVTPLHDLRCLWRLIRYIRREKIDIVHTHTPKAGLLGMLAAWLCMVPHRFHTVAGMPLTESVGVKKLILKWTERITYWSATKVYPNSEKLKLYIEQNLFRGNNKLSVIGYGSSNGIDTSYFKKSRDLELSGKNILKEYGVNGDCMILTYIGRIVADKGINELVEAFQKLNKKKSEKLRLFLIGDFEDDLNPVNGHTRQTIENDANVFAIGFKHDIRPYLAITDVFVFPSYREGFPNVVLQACAMEVACIASDINGCNEIITHLKTGLLIPSKNVTELYEAMNLLVDNHSLRGEMAKKSRKRVVEKFAQNFLWEEIVKEYKKQLNV
ncbi:glycosyltransferase family 4 protein [Fulvivirga ulvae]|uniref:glycosyltransferase family 4 protein n=1 Tax=Fulvivirga ulvae TaxID=2904245 RepID=UPI001F18071E|nr:glycosyltransferase family 4 protein [Fulvivirga ulvae]UII31644.1 glycosyltransferase family 4 protein [Fulvivirga ulvae]